MTDHPATRSRKIVERFFPEVAVSGFSHVDGSVGFYSQIAARLKPTDQVLDFGAGRGEPIMDDPVPYRRALANLQGRCAHVEGCDVDPVVLTNPFLDSARIIKISEPLPYQDASFDMIVSRHVFEHVEDPAWMAQELLRVTKPGGWICAVTPNSWGYIATAARMIPNWLHVRSLKRIQPERKAEDVFPTKYRMNTKWALKRWFGDHANIYAYLASSEPAYHFNSYFIFGMFKVLHKLLPEALQTTLFIFIRKHNV